MSYKKNSKHTTIWDAADNGDWVFVKQWLERDPSLIGSADDKKGSTLLHIAAASNHSTEVLEYLVSHGADVNMKDFWGMTPLHYAAQSNSNEEVLKCLVSHGADVNAKAIRGSTPLHEAARYNTNVEILRFLVSQGADINAKNTGLKTPLDYAYFSEEKTRILHEQK